MNFRELMAYLALTQFWGISFVLVQIGGAEMHPAFLMEARVIISVLCLVLYAKVLRQKLVFRGQWRHFAILGLLNCALPMSLIVGASQYMTASLAAILIACVPLFTATINLLWLKESLSLKKVIGLLIGLAGVMIVVGWNPVTLSLELVVASGVVLAAAFSFGVSGVYSKIALKGIAPLSLTTGQQIGATIWLLPLALLNPPAVWPSAETIMAVIFLGIFSTALAFLLMFYLTARIGPVKSQSITYLIPVAATVWGALLLGESVGMGVMLGFGVIVAGLLLVNDVRFGRPRQMTVKAAVRP